MTASLWHRMVSGALAVAAVGWMVACSGCGGGAGLESPGPQVGIPLVGMWGAKDIDAALQLTSTGGRLFVLGSCGWGGPLDAPVVPDTSGHFDVTGTYTSNIPPERVHYVGSVRGHTITLTVIDAANLTRAVYTLIRDQKPPDFTGGCPG